ncbi:unnamed protein product [Phaedon cochleariae]|uniref:C2H2-type domain-containing protein n=1 Tax=Phaedon cochleariae TaxID=80249 RepID=A0A9N9SG96_PHACE|nr:unnamed protein product [Phaedon cochleariae]
MANRRMGGMGGGLRGNRSQQSFGGGGVNPWQGGMSSGMSHNSMGQGLLSQLTSNPQQLALALTSLLQPQQQHPPSLLSLNTSPAFSNQTRDFNRFGPNNRGRDFRRHEPYNKNQNRNSGNQHNRNNDRRRSGNNQNKRDDKKSDAKKEEKKEVKKEKVDVSIDDANEESGDTKRDWKDEKNNAEEKKEEGGEKEKKGGKDKSGPYFDIPAKFLRCFVCNKVMWDGESMQKHVRGRAHKEMLGTLEESVHITVNILRENMRLMEERKVIEMQRVQRGSKRFKPSNEIESSCNMCDLKFYGKILSHRRNEGHQRLKRYLHPVCRMCDKEFPSRMEWIEHCLTPEHLRKLNEVLNAKTGSADGDIILTEDDNELNLEPLLEESLQVEIENPVLELTDDLNGLQNLMPAYKPDRAISTQSLKPFTGFRCELCNRSFEREELGQRHLKTKLHYHQFIGACKKALKDRQRKEREEKEAKKSGDAKKQNESQDSQAEGEADGDQEMYDPEEATAEEESSVMEVSQEDEEGGDPSVINNADLIEMVDEEEEEEEGAGAAEGEKAVEEEEEAVVEEEEEEAVVEAPPPPQIKPEPVKKEAVKKEVGKPTQTSTPQRQTATRAAAAGAVRNGAGPKSKKVAARKQ